MSLRHQTSKREYKSTEDFIDRNGLNLDFTILRDEDLTGINLSNASIRFSEIINTRLQESNISNSNFFFLKFIDVDLNKADFKNANLENVKFVDCNLSGADLTGARLLRTEFNRSILDGCKIKFHKFFDLQKLVHIKLGLLPECLYSELMKRDFYGRQWGSEKQKLTNRELFEEICKFKCWGYE